MDSIRTWASTNKLKLTLKKSVEIVFVDSTRRRHVQLLNPLDSIPRVSSIKILGVTVSVSSHLSVSEHVSSVITRSHGVVRTTVKVNGEWQNLTLSRR